jgi:hypothetical protein
MSKIEGSYRIATQSGLRGYLAELTIQVDLRDEEQLEIAFLSIDKRWRRGVEFGLAYAFEKCAGVLGPMGAHVAVQLRGHLVDTTEALAAYAAAMAFFSALRCPAPNGLELRIGTGEVIFPK